MNILFVGDIVGRTGRETVKALLPGLRKEFDLEFVIANGENAAGGSGLTPRIVEELLGFGIDVITTGDHIFKKREVLKIINEEPRLLRPANFPPLAPGRGSGIFKTKNGNPICVINLIGRIFMEARDCPFRKVKEEIEANKNKASLPAGKVILVDMHAEATSEKVAMGWYLDGLVSACLGTHTHIQTADEKILVQGCAYISDVGMTGATHSVIGRKIEDVLSRFITQVNQRFEVATENPQLQGVVLDIEEETGKARSIRRVQRNA